MFLLKRSSNILLLTFLYSWKVDPILGKNTNGANVICGVRLKTELTSWPKCQMITWQGGYLEVAGTVNCCIYFTSDGLL